MGANVLKSQFQHFSYCTRKKKTLFMLLLWKNVLLSVVAAEETLIIILLTCWYSSPQGCLCEWPISPKSIRITYPVWCASGTWSAKRLKPWRCHSVPPAPAVRRYSCITRSTESHWTTERNMCDWHFITACTSLIFRYSIPLITALPSTRARNHETNLCIICEKNCHGSLVQVHTVTVFLPIFVKPYQT